MCTKRSFNGFPDRDCKLKSRHHRWECQQRQSSDIFWNPFQTSYWKPKWFWGNIHKVFELIRRKNTIYFSFSSPASEHELLHVRCFCFAGHYTIRLVSMLYLLGNLVKINDPKFWMTSNYSFMYYWKERGTIIYSQCLSKIHSPEDSLQPNSN